MKIKVKSSHIKNESILKCSSCPLALALYEYGFINVTVLATKFVHSFLYISVYLPTEAIEFIRSFDGGQVVKPFEFEI